MKNKKLMALLLCAALSGTMIPANVSFAETAEAVEEEMLEAGDEVQPAEEESQPAGEESQPAEGEAAKPAGEEILQAEPELLSSGEELTDQPEASASALPQRVAYVWQVRSFNKLDICVHCKLYGSHYSLVIV